MSTLFSQSSVSRIILYGIRGFFLLVFLCLPLRGDEDTVPEVEIRVVAEDLSGEVETAEDVDLEQTSSVYSVIDVTSEKGKASSLGEILEQKVGLQIKKSGTAGSFATVSLRGTSSNQVAVYVDGIPLNTGRNGNIDLSDIPLDLIERIEVFRGSAPAEFSDSPIGGIINIKTTRSLAKEHFTCSITAESFSTYRGVFKGFETFSGSDLIYSLSFLSTQGDFDFTDNNGTEFNTDDDTVEQRINNDLMQGGLDVKWRLYAGDDTVVTLSEMITAKEQGIPGRENNQSEHARYSSEMSFLNITVEKGNIGDADGELFLRVFWKSQYDEFKDLDSEVGLGSQHMCSAINEIGLSGLGKFTPISCNRSAKYSSKL